MAEATLPPPLPFIPPDVQNAAQQAATRQSNTQSTARTSNQTARTTTSVRQPRTSRRALRLGQRAARFLSGAVFGRDAGITKLLGRGLDRKSRSEYQNASAMEVLPPSGEAERVQEAQSQSTLNIISATLQRIEATVNSIAEGSTRRGGAGEAGGGEGGGGILGLLSSIIGGMGAAAGGGIAALGGLIMRTVGRIARAIFSRIPIIGPLILVAMNIEGAMEEYERNGLGAAVIDLLAGIGSDLTFGIIDKDKIKELINGAVETLKGWWNAATAKLEELMTGIGDTLRGFFGWISGALQSAYDTFTRRRRELEEASQRGQQEAEENRNQMTPGQRAGRGVGNTWAQMVRRNPERLSEDRVEEVLNTLSEAGENETPEQSARRQELLREFQGTGRLTQELASYLDTRATPPQQATGRSMDEELNYTPTPTVAAPAVNNNVTTPTAEAPAVNNNVTTPTAEANQQPDRAPNNTQQQVSQQENTSQPTNERANTTGVMPGEVPPSMQVEGTFDIQRFRRSDPEGARIFQQRVIERSQQLEQEFNIRDNVSSIRGTIERNRIVRANREQARAQAEQEILRDPEIVERINRSGAGNLTIVRQPNTRQQTNPGITDPTTTTQQPNAPVSEPTQQVPPTTNIVPAPNAEDRSRALSESAPGPTVIPVPVPQPVPTGGGGGGGGSMGGGGAGPTSASPAQMQPPSHPARPADFITPQVSRY